MAQIRVENLHKAFADFVAVKDSTFTVADGEFFCLLGPSGCGKTTTLRMIAGLELPTSGEIFIDGEEVSQRPASQRDIAFVFQMFALYPHMNVRRNIAFPLVSQGMARAQIDAQVDQAARTLRITHLLDKPVSQLSSGDRQRVALGRAIVRQPKAFLMDEPLGALDAEFREVMCRELRALHDRLGATTVYVTHDQMEAMAMADVIAIMNDGVVEQIGAPQEVYERPASVFVANFVGAPSMNFLPFEAALARGEDAIQIGPARLNVPALHEDIGTCALLAGVRPEHVRFADDSALRATGSVDLGAQGGALSGGQGHHGAGAQVLGAQYFGAQRGIVGKADMLRAHAGKQGARADVLVQGAQLAAHQLAELGIQGAQRLVHQKGLRLAHDGSAQRHALAVAAGELRHRLVQQVADAQRARRRLDLARDLVPGHALRHQRKGNVAAHVHVRIEREHLEHEGDVALRCALEAHVLVGQEDLARGRQFESGDHPQRGGLAAARGAEQAEELAVAHGKAGVLDGGEVREGLVQMVDPDFCHLVTPGTSTRS